VELVTKTQMAAIIATPNTLPVPVIIDSDSDSDSDSDDEPVQSQNKLQLTPPPPVVEPKAQIEERLALIEEFANENEDTIREPMSKAQEADIKFNPIWCNKYETKGIKHFKKSSKIYSDYTQFLPKITEQKSSSSSFKTQEVYFYLLNNRRLIALGGDPLISEKEGGLSLAFIFEHIHNSGLSEKTPLFFHCKDNGRVISNIFKRVWRIVNKYDQKKFD